MTEAQYEKYVKIKEEIEPVKNMLFWCGNRYANKLSLCRYLIRAILRPKLLLGRIGCGCISSEEYELPKELQDKLIMVMEEWVADKEKQLESI